MNTRHAIKLFSLIILLSLQSCLDKIDLQAPKDLLDDIAINGKVILGDPAIVDISISRVFDFDAGSLQPFSARAVLLIDEQGNEIQVPDFAGGRYLIRLSKDNPDFQIREDGQYKIRVSTFDNRTYESTFEGFRPTPKPDSLTISLVPVDIPGEDGQVFTTEDFVQFAISTPTTINGEGTKLRWEYEQTFRVTDSPGLNRSLDRDAITCYVTETTGLATIKLFDASELTIDYIEKEPVLLLPITRLFAEGFYLTAFQQALSDGAFKHWEQVNAVRDREGSFFDLPVGSVITNLSNVDDPEEQVFGYFYAVTQDTIRTFVSPDFVGNPQFICPPPPGPAGSDPCLQFICCDCLSAEKSSTERPDFWIE